MAVVTEPEQLAPEQPARPPRRAHPLLFDSIIAAALAIGWAVVRVIALPPPRPSDPINYLASAASFPHQPAERFPVHEFLRLSVVLPTRLFYAMWGYSQASHYALPIITGMGLVVSVYFLGRLLFSRSVGIASAILVMGNVAIFISSGDLMPDLLSTGLFTAAVVLAVALRQERALVSSSARRRVVTLLAIGWLLAWSYGAREYVVFLWPLIAWLLWRPVGWRRLLIVVIPIAVFVGMELIIGAVIYGEPFIRLKSAVLHGSTGLQIPPSQSKYRHHTHIWYVIRLPSELLRYRDGRWMVGMFSLSLFAGIVARRRFGWLAVWVALLWVPLTVLGGSINPLHPKLRLALLRYWFPIFPAMIVASAGVVWVIATWLVHRVPRARIRTAIVSVIMIVAASLAIYPAIASERKDPRYRNNGATQLEVLRTWLHKQQTGLLWAEIRTLRLARMFENGPFGGKVWHGRMNHLARPSDPQPGDYVLIYSLHSSKICSVCYINARIALGSPPVIPKTWKPVFFTPDRILVIFRVAGSRASP